ncbi:hypothetical protein CIPAW_13G157800 [Carya illinoinensis]|uniref:Uncharacterized protein n=1 Tax=Carya illinoinensis TaxID=32201 RepID=A0A8T1NT79_CARIL|nr:hypothetical protein CIPAW_13G157800 [Carya illinoinensis]KAG6632415.1 hypothetical protein CIPAW_13G157800 [Carya illinoinensis]
MTGGRQACCSSDIKESSLWEVATGICITDFLIWWIESLDWLKRDGFTFEKFFKGLQHFRKMEPHDLRVMQDLNCSIVPVRAKVPRMIKWMVRDVGMLKLNVNGGSCGNPGMSGGGGVI